MMFTSKQLAILCLLVFLEQTYAKTFYIQPGKLNLHAAFMSCAAQNMQLATKNTQADQTNLENAIKMANKENELMWLAGSDLGNHGTYSWMTTGQPFAFSKWSPGEPLNGGNEHCVHVWPQPPGTISWNNVSCDIEYYYVCESNDLKIVNIYV